MLKKLKAIWKIIWSDQYAVFIANKRSNPSFTTPPGYNYKYDHITKIEGKTFSWYIRQWLP